MINQPFGNSSGKRNWFTHSPLIHTNKDPSQKQTSQYRFKRQKDMKSTICLQTVSNWVQYDPKGMTYNALAKGTPRTNMQIQQRVDYKNVEKVEVFLEVSSGHKMATLWKFEDPITNIKVDQITPFFDAMKDAKLL
jgi:hypothetical protein|tara:strand:+ start:7694 stop:8101 length:408 start_codon:yes stop_codon:yes gene_type:complete